MATVPCITVNIPWTFFSRVRLSNFLEANRYLLENSVVTVCWNITGRQCSLHSNSDSKSLDKDNDALSLGTNSPAFRLMMILKICIRSKCWLLDVFGYVVLG